MVLRGDGDGVPGPDLHVGELVDVADHAVADVGEDLLQGGDVVPVEVLVLVDGAEHGVVVPLVVGVVGDELVAGEVVDPGDEAVDEVELVHGHGGQLVVTVDLLKPMAWTYFQMDSETNYPIQEQSCYLMRFKQVFGLFLNLALLYKRKIRFITGSTTFITEPLRQFQLLLSSSCNSN